MIIWGCHDPATAEQEWWFIDTNNGYYWIQNRKSLKCLTVLNNSTADNAAVIQYDCNLGDNEQWFPQYQFYDLDFNKDAYVLINRHSGRCLTVKNASSSDGATLLQFGCNVGRNQQWTWYTPVR
ncbi:MAG: hypothetical protein V7603_6663 [Micromonosporaceae bacterium]